MLPVNILNARNKENKSLEGTVFVNEMFIVKTTTVNSFLTPNVKIAVMLQIK